MNEIFCAVDGMYRVSIADSSMMWIVHQAMEKAHERLKSKEGIIERLNEISKFYELAIMQLEGCVKVVQEETTDQTYILETGHEEVLTGLSEIKTRLQGRLRESEMAIMQKDRELRKSLDNELRLRNALEVRERELVVMQAKLELERTKSEDRDSELCELKNSVDQKLELDNYNLNRPQEEEEIEGVDDEKVEEMGSEVDILKKTLNLAFGKMFETNIEKDTMSILLKGFTRDFQEKVESNARKQEKQVSIGMNKHLLELMNEVKCLQDDLENIVGQKRMQPLKSVDRVHKFEESVHSEEIITSKEEEWDADGSRLVAKMIKNHESIIRKKSAEAEELNRLHQEILREKVSFFSKGDKEDHVHLKRRIQKIIVKLENLMNWNNSKVCQSLNEDVVSQALPENKNREFGESDRQKSENEYMADVWERINKVPRVRNQQLQKQRSMLKRVKEETDFKTMMIEETYITLLKGLLAKFDDELHSYKSEILISDGVHRVVIKDMVDQWNKIMESADIESQTREEIYCIVITEAMNDYNTSLSVHRVVIKEMVDQWDKITESADIESRTREEIYCIVITEAINDYNCAATEQNSGTNLEEKIKDDDYAIESLLREEISWILFDRSMVFVRDVVRELMEKKDANYDRERLIKQEMYQRFTQVYEDFEKTTNEKLGMIMFRLEELKHVLGHTSQLISFLREKESLYQKAFISRSQNLWKAEKEVDLLGDQVDVLLGILEKVYSTLRHYAPVLHQHFDVSDILDLVKKEIV